MKALPYFRILAIIALTSIFFSASQADAQELLWTSSYGGTDGNGAIISYDLNSSQLSTKYSLTGNPLIGSDIFLNTDSWQHPGALTLGSDGNYYGISSLNGVGTTNYNLVGGNKNNTTGVFYKMDPVSYQVTILHVFKGNKEYTSFNPGSNYLACSAYNNGLASPIYAPLEYSPGIFYGLANEGGEYGAGGIYRMNTTSGEYAVIASFNPDVHGESVYSPLTKGDGDNVYGILQKLHNNHFGFLYKLDVSTQQLSYVSDLSPNTGTLWVLNHPFGSLVYDGFLNKLFGVKDRFNATSNWGGGCYTYDIATGDVENRFTITWSDLGVLGSQSQGIIRGNNGKFYIVTVDGGANNNGTIIEYDYQSNVPVKVHDFPTYGGQYSFPSGEGLQVFGSKIYGFYEISGTTGEYSMWVYDYASGSFNSFLPSDETGIGIAIQTSFIKDDDKLICRSVMGGAGDVGNTFTYDLISGSTSIIKSNQSPNGRNLIGGIEYYNDSLIAVINKGGNDATKFHESGGFLKLDPYTNQGEILDGKTIQSDGIFSQVTMGGSIIENDSSAFYINNYHTSFSFGKRLIEVDLSSGHIEDRLQLFYDSPLTGPTTYGDSIYFASNDSLVAYHPTDHSYSSKFIGLSSDFGSGAGELCVSDSGVLYGTTSNTNFPSAQTSIYSYNPSTGQTAIEFSFDTNIRNLNSKLTMYNGLLYGNTNYSGDNQNGYLFSFDPVSKTMTKLHHFDGATEGSVFEGEWLLYQDELYALSYTGGNNHHGTLVKYDLSSNSLSVLAHLDVSNGNAFKATPFYWQDTTNTNVHDIAQGHENIIYPNPAHHVIQWSHQENISQVNLFNATGQLIISEYVDGKQLDVSQIESGIYFIQFLNNKQLIGSSKIVIQH